MAAKPSAGKVLALLISAGALLAMATAPAAAQYTGLYADFDLDYIFKLPPGASEFYASEQLVYPEWWIELENVSGDAMQINALIFDAPYPFTYTFPLWDEVNGYTYTFPDEALLPGGTYTIRAEQETEGEQLYIPFAVSRQISGSEITGDGDVTISFSVTAEEGMQGLYVIIPIVAAESREDWEQEDYFGTVEHVHVEPVDDYLDHTTTPYAQIYEWSYPDYTPGQEYYFECTVHVALDPDWNHAFYEPAASAAAHRIVDYGTEVWTDNIVDVPAPHTGTVEVNSDTAISNDNPHYHIPWIGVEMPLDVELYSDTDVFHVPTEFSTIQSAIDAAVGPTLILVDPATYYEMIDLKGKQVVIRSIGGPQATTIDAQGNGTVVTADSGEGSDTVLDGFTITGGSAYHGGGAYIRNSDPTFIDCVFDSNTATGSSWYEGGGAIRAQYIVGEAAGRNDWAMTLSACVFTSNSALNGGAVYLYGERDGPSFTANVLIQDCMFLGNSASGKGGALFGYNDSDDTECRFEIADSTFIQNDAECGGAAGFERYGNVQLTGCTFTANTAEGLGGAVDVSGGALAATSCAFADNSAVWGGGIFAGDDDYDSTLTLTDCTIDSNDAVYGGGAFIAAWGDIENFTDCTFSQNTAYQGAGMQIYEGVAVLEGCSFEENVATSVGGGISNVMGYLGVGNSYFCGNDPEHIDGYCDDYGGNEFDEVCPGACPADFDGDGDVDTADLLHLLGAWGTPDGDVDGDGDTDTADLLALLGAWGQCP